MLDSSFRGSVGEFSKIRVGRRARDWVPQPAEQLKHSKLKVNIHKTSEDLGEEALKKLKIFLHS